MADSLLRMSTIWFIARRTARLYRGWTPWASHRRRQHVWARR
jgi:hypothetical protein